LMSCHSSDTGYRGSLIVVTATYSHIGGVAGGDRKAVGTRRSFA